MNGCVLWQGGGSCGHATSAERREQSAALVLVRLVAQQLGMRMCASGICACSIVCCPQLLRKLAWPVVVHVLCL